MPVLPEKIGNQKYFFTVSCLSRAKVGELLPHVSSPKIHLQYAKAKEADGRCVCLFICIYKIYNYYLWQMLFL